MYHHKNVWGHLAACTLSLTFATAGLALSAATPATAATELSQTECADDSYLFQVRDGGKELWSQRISSANAETPEGGSWEKVYEFRDSVSPALSVAAHSAADGTISLFVSARSGGLRSYAFDTATGQVGQEKVLATGTADKPGAYRFVRLTSDGTNLFGVKKNQLYRLADVSTDQAPTDISAVKGFSFTPRTLFANIGSSGRDWTLGWTTSDGTLHYSKLAQDDAGWSERSFTVRPQWSTSRAITSPGAGLLLRGEGGETKRSLVDNPGSSTASKVTTDTLDAIEAPEDAAITTSPTACTVPQLLPVPEETPYPAENGEPGTYTPRTQYIVDELKKAFPDLRCGTYEGGRDHATGNATDCRIGAKGELPTEAERARLQDAREWLVTYARPLRIQSVIFENHIWNIDKDRQDSPGRCQNGCVRPTTPEQITRWHFDHLHISATGLDNDQKFA